jgi:hypothetical protein
MTAPRNPQRPALKHHPLKRHCLRRLNSLVTNIDPNSNSNSESK